MRQRNQDRVRTAVRPQSTNVPWWVVAVAAAALVAAMPTFAQTGIPQAGTPQSVAPGPTQPGSVPEVVRPQGAAQGGALTTPPSADSGGTVQPRSENPQVSPGARPSPDRGVIAPPAGEASTTPVIRPPAMGTMPVIPPPGSAGGDKGVIPK